MTSLESESGPPGYCEQYIPRPTLEKLEAGAFEQLCAHLRDRSDQVENITLMTVSGFCRNCLAKWMVVEARRLSDGIKQSHGGVDKCSQEEQRLLRALDALGYDEAAQHVYGMGYGEWKKRYAKKASDDTMGKYNSSKPIHATHNKELLETRAEKPEAQLEQTASENRVLLANVCCQNPEAVASTTAVSTTAPMKTTRTVQPKIPDAPSTCVKFSVAILTVSDRAAAGKYETGDLSGPAVAQSIQSTVDEIMGRVPGSSVEYKLVETAIVPDDIAAIQTKLKEWSMMKPPVDFALTTGGTGFSPRDITPEATRGVLDKECSGLMSFVTGECSKAQPMAALSRATAGVCGKTLIANLPGNPKGVSEVIPVLLPLALHAIVDLQKKR